MSASLQQQVMQALMRARATGQPVLIPGGDGLVATPQGATRMGSPGELAALSPYAGVPNAPSAMGNPTALNPFGPVPTAGPGVPAGTPTAVPGGAAPGQQQPGFQLGANAGTPMPPASWFNGTPSVTLPAQTITATRLPPDPATAARNYRLAHGLGSAADRIAADQLNRLSLQAAQQGRNYWAPGTTVQPGQLAPNLLTMPPSAGAANANALAPQPNIHWLQNVAQNADPNSGLGGVY